jgi:hypothetical protein
MGKIQSKKRYLLAFLIGTFIFINGFVVTNIILSIQFNRLSQFQDQISFTIFEDKLNYRLFDADPCTIDNFNKISKSLNHQGRSIANLEEKFGKNNNKVKFRKIFYSLVELEHFEFINEINEKCEKDFLTILFFYSNHQRDIDKSEMAGKLLDHIAQKNENLIIYSFDINLDSEIIQNLKELYKIEESPTIIINKNKKISGNIQLEDIEENLISVKGEITNL